MSSWKPDQNVYRIVALSDNVANLVWVGLFGWLVGFFFIMGINHRGNHGILSSCFCVPSSNSLCLFYTEKGTSHYPYVTLPSFLSQKVCGYGVSLLLSSRKIL